MDKDRSNHVGLQLFLEGCKALGYEDEDEANCEECLFESFVCGFPERRVNTPKSWSCLVISHYFKKSAALLKLKTISGNTLLSAPGFFESSIPRKTLQVNELFEDLLLRGGSRNLSLEDFSLGCFEANGGDAP